LKKKTTFEWPPPMFFLQEERVAKVGGILALPLAGKGNRLWVEGLGWGSRGGGKFRGGENPQRVPVPPLGSPGPLFDEGGGGPPPRYI